MYYNQQQGAYQPNVPNMYQQPASGMPVPGAYPPTAPGFYQPAPGSYPPPPPGATRNNHFKIFF